jgi:hypothetical protein
MLGVVDKWADLISGFDIRRSTAQAILQALHIQASLLH